MNERVFDSMNDFELPQACFEPLIPLIRAKDGETKLGVYQSLNPSQKALFMFNVYYNHAFKSLEEFYWWTLHYYRQPEAWQGIKNSLSFFGAAGMQGLLGKIEELPGLDGLIGDAKELTADTELSAAIGELYKEFERISLQTLAIIGAVIRHNPRGFVELEKNI